MMYSSKYLHLIFYSICLLFKFLSQFIRTEFFQIAADLEVQLKQSMERYTWK